MAGLLDMFGGSPQQQGLLAAAAQILQQSGPSLMPRSFGQIAGGGLLAGQQAFQQAKEQEAMGLLRGMQLEEAQGSLADRKRKRGIEQQISEAARASFQTPGQQAASLPGGPTVANAAQIPNMQGGFDTESFLSRAMSIDPLMGMQLSQSMRKAGPKYDKDIVWVNRPDGKPLGLRMADDGTHKVLEDLSPREKLHFLNTGGKTLGVGEFSGEQVASFGNTASPDSILSSLTSRRGQDMMDSRARDLNEITRQGQRTQLINDPNQGPLLVDKGTGFARPAVGLDGKPIRSESAAKKAFAAKGLLPVLDNAEKLIDGATGSYLGAGADQVARVFGGSTDGAKNIAQLKVLEGQIMMNQPRMEGPQSNMDVQLYRQMAGMIGDPTVPGNIKKAALSTIRDITSRYAGEQAAPAASSSGGWSITRED